MASFDELIPKKKYRLYVELGYKPNGKRDRRTKVVKASGPRQAQSLLKDFEQEVKKTRHLDQTKISFPDFSNRWKKNYAIPELEPPTAENYTIKLEGTILPFFEHFKLKEVSTFDIIEFFNHERELNRGSLETKYKILQSIFKHAVQWKIIDKDDNPMSEVKMPSDTKKQKKDFYRKHELPDLMRLLKTLEVRQQHIVKLALFGGLRRGEIAGLADDVVDFENNLISVKRSLQLSKTEGLRLKDTKAEDTRIVALPKTFMRELNDYYKERKALQEEIGDLWKGFKDVKGQEVFLLFANEYGIPHRPDSITTFWNRFMNRFEGKIRRVRFHDLRHSSATIILTEGAKKGITMKTVQKRLGHKDIKTTLNFYAHVAEDQDKEAGDIFEDV
ncbi:site-specific integrase [Lederbergia sp. NSJ-179]|uniref:tyrosine-type recombinase/integrase n=1 Tax=Lederbergia sp. NSJ-179 TaxID=2931402 RepID=UPI001FD429BC|nr:site-specific integrase [Lederbergia sp. NSJ-179]MCJ7839948.1 site-specific integrase [Lederbergia sp. NSJ-179]